MRDHIFNFEELFNFSNGNPYDSISAEYQDLYSLLEKYKLELNFPAIQSDIGSFIALLTRLKRPQIVFEMGSGYGQSAFWFLKDSADSIEKIILTEKRDDLKTIYESLPWPTDWKAKLEYHQGDAFEVLNTYHAIDMALVDGVKADYLRFIEKLYPKMKVGSIVFIDNSYWRGSFLDADLRQKKASARSIFELHEYLRNSNLWDSIFIPYKDGLSILFKK